MKRFALLTLTLLATLLLLAGCSGTSGTPPVITFDGTEVVLGESTLRVLDKEDFTATTIDGTAYGYLPARTWLQQFLTVKKEDKTYLYAYLYNPEKEQKTVQQCVIYKTTIKFPKEDEQTYWADTTLINGVNLFGMDRDAVKEAMSHLKLTNEGDRTLNYQDGSFKYFIRFVEDTGIIDEIQLEMTIPKSYS